MARHASRRLALAAVLLAAALAGCGGAGRAASKPGAHGERARLIALFGALPTFAPPPNLPADCVPLASGVQIQLGAYATFSGSLSIDTPTGQQMVAAHISGSLCGKGFVVNPPAPPQCPAGTPAGVELTIPPDGEVFDLPGVQLTAIPGLTITVTHTTITPTPISAVLCAGEGAPGPLEAPCYVTQGHAPPCLPLRVAAQASASLLGTDCVISVTVPVRASIWGPLSGFTVDAVNEPFSLNLPTPTSSCPPYLDDAIGSLLDFPKNAAGDYEPLTPGLIHLSILGTGVAYYESS